MRNFPFRILGAASIFLAAQSSVSAQNFIKPKPRPAAPAFEVSAPSPALLDPSAPSPGARIVAASKNSPLTPGAEVSFRIAEENEPPVRVIVADTGELEIPGGLGAVQVNGRSSAQAEALVKSHLEGRFYKPGKATVQIALKTLPASGQKVSKVKVSGKVGRQGVIAFYASDPKKLSEAILEAGPTTFSDLTKVKVTRGGETKEHDVKSVLEGKNDKDDVELQEGDVIYVPPRPIVLW